jgi:hypothetical protein
LGYRQLRRCKTNRFHSSQLRSYRISQDVRTCLAKGWLTLLRPKHVVVGLVLPLTLVAVGLKLSTKELHCIKLVTLLAQPIQTK